MKLSHLPLAKNENIFNGNAARLDWRELCPNNGTDEIYLVGNPPYKGGRLQTDEQKTDFREYFGNEDYSGNLDYISIWFIKGARYITGTKARLAFVSTNSIVQGEHVGIMFPKILKENIEIGFAYTSFKWQNSARDNAGVTVIILGLRNVSSDKKYIFSDGIISEVKNINPYLLPADNIIINTCSKPISEIPELNYGSFALDDGNFTISKEEYDSIISKSSEAKKYLRPFIGAAEFLRGIKRWAIWILDSDYDDAKTISIINDRIEKVRDWRIKSSRKSTKKLAATPWRFAEIRHKDRNCIITPIVSSERREYIPMDFLTAGTIISNQAFAIYDADPWLFALLESKMHMAWIRTVCGKLKTDYRYSSTLGYNTFPVPPLSDEQKIKLNASARAILLARDAHFELTLAEMYDSDKMPFDLREAHDKNDIVVDQLYRVRGFANDEDRLATLFALYEQMTSKKGEEKSKKHQKNK